MAILYEWFNAVELVPLGVVDMRTFIPYIVNVALAVGVTALVLRTVVQIAKLFTDWRWR